MNTNNPTKLPKTPPPKVGDDVYVGGSMYLSHGMDDFQGGLCKITKVSVGISAGEPEWFIEIKERPGTATTTPSSWSRRRSGRPYSGRTVDTPTPTTARSSTAGTRPTSSR